MVPVVRLQHYTQSWIFLVRETAFFGLILLPALEFTCVTTSASRWVFCLCVVCISMRVERCSLFSFPSPCPEICLKLTSYFIYSLFHLTSLLQLRIYEARKQEPHCSCVSFSPFSSLFDFLSIFCTLAADPIRTRLGQPPRCSAPLTQPRALFKSQPPPRCPGIAAWHWEHKIPALAEFDVQNHQDLTSSLSFSPSCGSTESRLCCLGLGSFLLSSVPLSSILSSDLTSWPPFFFPGVD